MIRTIIKIKVVYILKIIFPISALSQTGNYWQQHVQYNIYVSLDPRNHLLHGTEIITYTNNSPDTLDTFYIHLYPNAYNEHSLMAQEMAKRELKLIRSPEDSGYININHISLSIITDSSIISLNNSFEVDETLLKIDLSQQLFPYQQLIIKLDFTVKVSKYNNSGGKGGYVGDHYVISQWYPKVCVYDENGWDTMPYHWLGEFYGEFGIYDVTVNVPFQYIVGATGIIISGDPGWQTVKVDSTLDSTLWEQKFEQIKDSLAQKSKKTSRRVVSFHAENVHDFIWVANPDFAYRYGKLDEIPVHILFSSNNSKFILENSISALKWLKSFVGKYPYPQLLVTQSLGNNSMEYPLVALIGRIDKNTITHEIVHMYFYGALANNEQTEGWLDEGLVSFLTEVFVKNLEEYPNFRPSILDSQFLPVSYNHIRLNYLYYYLYSGLDEPISIPGYKNKDKVFYSLNNYIKGAHFFRMLRHVVGKENFQKIIQTYYDTWRFKHVNEKRFKDICERVSKMELDWFFNEWLHNTVKVDYALSSMKKFKQSNEQWKTEIKLKRRSNGIMPVDVALFTQDGKKYVQRWDGKTKFSRLTFYSSSEPTKAVVDPKDLILDQFRLNNRPLNFKFIVYPGYPNLYYQPRDSYLISGWLRFWYNNIDHLKVGIKLFGGYLNRYYLSRAYLWYGFRSHQIDFRWTFSNPCEFLGKSAWYNFVIAKLDGRLYGNINLLSLKRRYLFVPPVHHIRSGILFYRLLDDKYVYQDASFKFWDDSKVNKLFIQYDASFKKGLLASNFNIQLESSHQYWGSNKNFTKIFGSYKFKYTLRTPPLTVHFRTFSGIAFHNNSSLPIQEHFYVAESSPLKRFDKFYFRSTGTVPVWLNYYLPGDGNLRGYFDKFVDGNKPLATDKLVSYNIEIIPRNISKVVSNRFCKINLNLFTDGGWFYFDSKTMRYLIDAGFGFTFSKKLINENQKLMLNFPIWLSHPNIDNLNKDINQFKFRWLFSLDSVF